MNMATMPVFIGISGKNRLEILFFGKFKLIFFH